MTNVYTEILFVLPAWDGEDKESCWRIEEGQNMWSEGGYDYVASIGDIVKKTQERPPGDVMADQFAEFGIPEEQIIRNETGYRPLDGYQNVICLILMLRKLGINNPRVTIVSHKTHAKRLVMVFKAYGVSAVEHGMDYHIPFHRQWIFEPLYLLGHIIDPKGESVITEITRLKRKIEGGYGLNNLCKGSNPPI
ncbi:MAG: hypothetical protein UU65_C0003G0040 [candidate division CPR2 bacterium GW2011_GWC1_41_48]|uniref:DUF218 domain-containing protein n=1 Tax=candidate division CPR2 bacterium GW2011_GWC1_41_48 TaxID=1618344 RepID=A0A0G0W7P8_UNCC2|nr:MAG: hypothetical protein UT47_C0003G0046 [candidate division CPR2 bacterium GW2011_GWC2_39_35]KKR28448.1 MAG: hypothetical protein UT59_C0027G0003 [candidate division CPR2 bacterium GW2011_GWD1_39_7]KKR29330.1 MAG: hypothetical protein UT60_C0003G0007 [candidate division CPR2 bacterium GW2011_GWD2_39_7]KKS08985.1 MAG: hypothetical protein UU65_C0003G0040 [candidate division CPR2 bacterium GW2011_GWC1_41_48]OGB71153.1 MAG: hypothetical protein A2Y26_04015 [candidate division CPR2 bacterium G